MALLTADGLPDGDLPSGCTGHPDPRPRRILPVLLLCFMAGLLVSAAWTFPLGVAIPAAFALLAASVVIRRRAAASLFLHAAVLASGILWMAIHDDSRRTGSIQQVFHHERTSVILAGSVEDMPDQVVVDSSGRTNWVFSFQADLLGPENHQRPVVGTVRVLLPADADDEPAYGDRWLLAGNLRKDDRSLLESRGVAGTVYADARRSRRLESGEGHALVAWCYAMRHKAHERLGWGMDADASSVAISRALLLGYRQGVDRSVHEAFVQTGTLHILALSGMHVGILVLLLVVVLKAMGVSRQHWVLWIAPILAVYTLATGAAPSMVRASIMATVYFSAFLFRRKPDVVTSLAMAALLILLIDPMQLFSMGFILSFLAVGGLVSIHPLIMKHWSVHETMPGRGEQGWWGRLSFRTRHVLLATASISLSAWVVTLPLITTISHLISPVALVVNLAMGPLSFVMLLTGCLSLLTGLVSEQVAITFNFANDVFCRLLLTLIEHASQWPGAYFRVVAWPLVAMAAWFGLLLVAMLAQARMRRAAWVGMVVMVVVSIGQRSWSDRVEAVVIPAGDANVLLIDGPGNQAVLFDAGSTYQNRKLVETLRSRGIKRIDTVWVTRATTDAYGGVAGLLDSMKVGTVIAPAPPGRHAGYLGALEAWRSHPSGPVVKEWPGDGRQESSGVVVRVLHPEPGQPYRDARRSSLVAHVSHGHRSVLFAGRVDRFAEEQYAGAAADWGASRLVIGSCLDADAFSKEWLDEVDPAHAHVNPLSLDRLTEGAGGAFDRLRRGGGTELILESVRARSWML